MTEVQVTAAEINEVFPQPQTIVKPKRTRRTKAEMLFGQTENTPTTENSGSKAPKGRKNWEDVVRQQINDIWGLMAVGLTFVNPVDAQILTDRAPNITEAIIHLAQVKPAFKRMLLRTSEGALYAEIIMAIAPIAILIACNHKMLPAFVAIPYGGVPTIKGVKPNDNASDNDAIPFDIFSLLSQAMATGRTPDNHRADGEWEDDVSA